MKIAYTECKYLYLICVCVYRYHFRCQSHAQPIVCLRVFVRVNSRNRLISLSAIYLVNGKIRRKSTKTSMSPKMCNDWIATRCFVIFVCVCVFILLMILPFQHIVHLGRLCIRLLTPHTCIDHFTRERKSNCNSYQLKN